MSKDSGSDIGSSDETTPAVAQYGSEIAKDLKTWPEPFAKRLVALAQQFPSQFRVSFLTLFTRGGLDPEFDQYVTSHPDTSNEALYEGMEIHGKAVLGNAHAILKQVIANIDKTIAEIE